MRVGGAWYRVVWIAVGTVVSRLVREVMRKAGL